jgi:hypothetical protein
MCPAADGDHGHGGLSAVSMVAPTPALLGSLTQPLLTCMKTTKNIALRQRKYWDTEGQADVTLGINTPPKMDRLGILVNTRLPGCAYDRSLQSRMNVSSLGAHTIIWAGIGLRHARS